MLEARGDQGSTRAPRRVSLSYVGPAGQGSWWGGTAARRIAAAAVLVAVVFGLAAWVATHRQSAREHESLAVLPFEASAESERFAILADGLTDSLIAELSRVPRLRVIARSSVYRHRDSNLDPRRIGRLLGADAVLAGSLHAIDGDIVVRAELIDVTAGHRLWGRTYRRPDGNLLALEGRIAGEIASELQTAITAGRQTATVPEAHQLYLEGRYHWNKRTREGFAKAIAAFERAIDLDPSFALAHAGLADVYNLLGTYGDRPPADSFPLAKAAALRAVELDPSLAEARTSLAYAIQNYDWDWEAAEREYRRALRLSPSYAIAHHWYGGFLMLMGRFDEAIAHRSIAAKLDPLSPSIQAAVGSPYFLARRYDRAIEIYQKALAMDPRYARGHFAIGWTYLLQGRTEEGIRAIERARELSNGSVEISAYLAYAYARAGRGAEAERLLRDLRQGARRRYVDPYEFARIEVALGRPANALADLERAYSIRSNLLMNLKVDPSLDPLRREPRFRALMEKMNFQKGEGE